MRRLDQGIGEIAQLPFVVGELELRRLQADASGRLGADPAMHVVVAEILAGAAEIAAAAAAERQRRSAAASGPVSDRIRGLVRIGKHVSGISKCPMSGADGDGGRGPYLLPVRCPPLVSSGSRSIRTTGRIRMVPMPSRGAPSMVEPSRREAASAGNSMMVPMSNLSLVAARTRSGRRHAIIKNRTWLTAS